jgi:raffinose/stachyose/melibiose transport system substrate-binding protein
MSDTYDNAQKALAEGSAAMLFQGSWVMDEINKKYPDKVNDIGAFTMPFEDQGRSSLFVPFGFFMTNKCSDAVLCKKVIEYLGSVATQQKFADAQPGLWTTIGITSKLLPAVEDLKKVQDEGRFNIWYGQQMTYPTDSPFATYLQEYYAGGKTVDKVLDATYQEMVKLAKAKNDPNFK